MNELEFEVDDVEVLIVQFLLILQDLLRCQELSVLQQFLFSLGLFHQHVRTVLHGRYLLFVAMQAVQLCAEVHFPFVLLSQLCQVIGSRGQLLLGHAVLRTTLGARFLDQLLHFLQVLQANDFGVASMNFLEQDGAIFKSASADVAST